MRKDLSAYVHRFQGRFVTDNAYVTPELTPSLTLDLSTAYGEHKFKIVCDIKLNPKYEITFKNPDKGLDELNSNSNSQSDDIAKESDEVKPKEDTFSRWRPSIAQFRPIQSNHPSHEDDSDED